MNDKIEQCRADIATLQEKLKELEKVEARVYTTGDVFCIHDTTKVMIVEIKDKAALVYLNLNMATGTDRSATTIEARGRYSVNDWKDGDLKCAEYLGNIADLIKE